jgi:hypothetical protein
MSGSHSRLGDDTGLAAKQPTSTARTFDAGLVPVPSHTDALMRSTLAADASLHIRGIVPWSMSSRRVAVRAASSFGTHEERTADPCYRYTLLHDAVWARLSWGGTAHAACAGSLGDPNPAVSGRGPGCRRPGASTPAGVERHHPAPPGQRSGERILHNVLSQPEVAMVCVQPHREALGSGPSTPRRSRIPGSGAVDPFRGLLQAHHVSSRW